MRVSSTTGGGRSSQPANPSVSEFESQLATLRKQADDPAQAQNREERLAQIRNIEQRLGVSHSSASNEEATEEVRPPVSSTSEASDTTTGEISRGKSGGVSSAYGQSSTSVSSSAPIRSTPEGVGFERHGPLRRGKEYYDGDPLSKFREPKGTIDPSKQTGALTSPYRDDGTAKSPYYDTTATGVYTEGNYWQNSQGEIVQGQTGVATVSNETDQNVIITGGMIPGNEQPGAAMTVVRPGDTDVQVPRPPEGERQPEMYVSVGDLDPTDGIGWHQSNRRPNDDPKNEDYGTPGFAYKMDVVGTNGTAYAGLGSNEGYDPALSGNPGYGIALYGVDGETGERSLLAVTNTVKNGDTAKTHMWADPKGHPEVGETGVQAQFGQQQINGGTFEYVYITPKRAESMIAEQRENEPAGYVSRQVYSTPEA